MSVSGISLHCLPFSFRSKVCNTIKIHFFFSCLNIKILCTVFKVTKAQNHFFVSVLTSQDKGSK